MRRKYIVLHALRRTGKAFAPLASRGLLNEECAKELPLRLRERGGRENPAGPLLSSGEWRPRTSYVSGHLFDDNM